MLVCLTISPSFGSEEPNKAGRSSNNMEVVLLYCFRDKYMKLLRSFLQTLKGKTKYIKKSLMNSLKELTANM